MVIAPALSLPSEGHTSMKAVFIAIPPTFLVITSFADRRQEGESREPLQFLHLPSGSGHKPPRPVSFLMRAAPPRAVEAGTVPDRRRFGLACRPFVPSLATAMPTPHAAAKTLQTTEYLLF